MNIKLYLTEIINGMNFDYKKYAITYQATIIIRSM